MKKFFFIKFAMLLMLFSCKKEPTRIGDKTNSDTISVIPIGEIISEKNAKNFLLSDLKEKLEMGKTLFYRKNGENILSFNTIENKGRMMINGRSITLTKLTFSENNFEILGENIKIIAENGIFKDGETNCVETEFPTITILYKNQFIFLEDIDVTHCPEYQ